MVTIATQHACNEFMKSPLAKELNVVEIIIEGGLSSDKKPSWGNVKEPRGVQVIAWGILTDQVCRKVLGCSTERLYHFQMTLKEGGIRIGQFGFNANAANIIAGIFISCGQDVGTVAEASWCQLTPEYDLGTKELKLALFFPSLPVGVVGGGTFYSAPQESLGILKCNAPGMKKRLAGLIASFALALEASTDAAIVNNTFTKSHERMGRGKDTRAGDPKL
jgi:hydroxymethylglutaryl-CoA reductase